MRKKNRDIHVEVDIFLPQGRKVDDWDFIKTLRMVVNTDNVERDVEEIQAAITGAVNEWKEDR